jgi:hypothetical protein
LAGGTDLLQYPAVSTRHLHDNIASRGVLVTQHLGDLPQMSFRSIGISIPVRKRFLRFTGVICERNTAIVTGLKRYRSDWS